MEDDVKKAFRSIIICSGQFAAPIREAWSTTSNLRNTEMWKL